MVSKESIDRNNNIEGGTGLSAMGGGNRPDAAEDGSPGFQKKELGRRYYDS